MSETYAQQAERELVEHERAHRMAIAWSWIPKELRVHPTWIKGRRPWVVVATTVVESTEMIARTHIDVVNEAAACVRMESDAMLRMEVRGLTTMIENGNLSGVATPIARAMLDMVLKEIERREKAQANPAQPRE
jgi:hypothetical protein